MGVGERALRLYACVELTLTMYYKLMHNDGPPIVQLPAPPALAHHPLVRPCIAARRLAGLGRHARPRVHVDVVVGRARAIQRDDGGGGGGHKVDTDFNVDAGTFPIAIGSGGVKNNGSAGQATVFSTLTAVGGGGGGYGSGGRGGGPGGSGGGGGDSGGGSGTSQQGNPGGPGNDPQGGGGGGSGTAGGRPAAGSGSSNNYANGNASTYSNGGAGAPPGNGTPGSPGNSGNAGQGYGPEAGNHVRFGGNGSAGFAVIRYIPV